MNIPSWCEHYVSIPYDELNCWGLVVLVYKEIFGIELTDKEDQNALVRAGFWHEVHAEDAQAPDVILFKERLGKRHVGLLLNEHYMIHSDNPNGVVIEKWTARNWKPRLQAVYRCKLIS
jgi:cell wall-associated NlpC family hydrolase